MFGALHFGNQAACVLQLISFLLLNLIKLETILRLVIVGDGWFYLKGPTGGMYVVLSQAVLVFIHFLLFYFNLFLALIYSHISTYYRILM